MFTNDHIVVMDEKANFKTHDLGRKELAINLDHVMKNNRTEMQNPIY